MELTTILEHLAVLHNHVCPRQVLGARMGLYAASLLGLEVPQTNKRLYTFVETDGCFADGVLVATGCSLGHRTMHLIDYGKVAATFVDTNTERALRLAPREDARRRAAELMPDAKSHWHAQLAAYQILSLDELFQVQDVVLTVSLAALISRPGVRVTCAQCGEEILNEREVLANGHTLCQSCAGTGYWVAAVTQTVEGFA